MLEKCANLLVSVETRIRKLLSEHSDGFLDPVSGFRRKNPDDGSVDPVLDLSEALKVFQAAQEITVGSRNPKSETKL